MTLAGLSTDDRIDRVIDMVRRQIGYNGYEPFNSPHEGFAHIRAALDRLWGVMLASSWRPAEPLDRALTLSAVAVQYVMDLTPYKPTRTLEEKREIALSALATEVGKAMAKHKPMVSKYEAYGVILEEVDELFEEVRPDRGREVSAQKEALQVAAMGIRYILDVVRP